MFAIISDTHFGHGKLIEIGSRPADFSSRIMKSVYAFRLTERDVLIHLGDFCIGNDAHWHESFLSGLHCRKWLILGNHDRKSVTWYLSHGWDFVAESFEMIRGGHRLLFTHIPVAHGEHGTAIFNIHGHTHGNEHRHDEVNLVSGFHRLIAMEQTNYMPLNLDKFLERGV